MVSKFELIRLRFEGQGCSRIGLRQVFSSASLLQSVFEPTWLALPRMRCALICRQRARLVSLIRF